MAHLVRKYNPGHTSEPVSLGSPPLSVDPVSAAWYRDNLPSKPSDPTKQNGVAGAPRVLTGTDVISSRLLESLRSIDPYAARKPPKGSTLADEYSKYSTTLSAAAANKMAATGSADRPSAVKKNAFGGSTKTVTFATPPNSDTYGGQSNGHHQRFPSVQKNDVTQPITSSFPSRNNDVYGAAPPYKTNDLPNNPSQAARAYQTSYGSTYGSSYGSRDPYTGKPRDDDRSRDERMRRNTLAIRSRENSSMYGNRENSSMGYGMSQNATPQREPGYGTDDFYIRKMAEIINQPTSALFPSSPSQISDFMFVGGYRDAENWMYLKRLGITHVLNTAAMRKSTYNPYPPESGIVGYESFDADDTENYDVMQHFPRAKAFIDRCKWSGGKVLVHCAMGVNRSGTMCCAYLMADQKMTLLDAVKRMKQRRYTTLTNRAFRQQLLRYARMKGHL